MLLNFQTNIGQYRRPVNNIYRVVISRFRETCNSYAPTLYRWKCYSTRPYNIPLKRRPRSTRDTGIIKYHHNSIVFQITDFTDTTGSSLHHVSEKITYVNVRGVPSDADSMYGM